MSDSICIVASTLPAAFIAKNIETLNVSRIITMSPGLAFSYKYLQNDKAKPIISLAPAGLFQQVFYFIFLVFFIKLTRKKIVFFHECCMPVLDLLVHYLRPQGEFYPQVSMLGSKPVRFDLLPNIKLLKLLRLLRQDRFFTCYYSPAVDDKSPEYSLSFKQYPPSIKSYDVSHSRGRIDECMPSKKGNSRHRILILLAKSNVPDVEQQLVFSELIDLACGLGFVCEVKNHPNVNFRVGFTHHKAVMIEPLMPSEFIVDNFDWVIGAASTSLLNYGERAVSVIDMFKSMSEEERMLAKRHFDMASPDHKIKYISNSGVFADLLTEVES